MRQIAAEELRCAPEEIGIEVLDTDAGFASDSGIGGSRGTRVASGASFQAASEAREKLLALAAELLGWPRSEIRLSGRELIHAKSKKRERWEALLARAGRSVVAEAVNRDDEHSPVTSFTAQVAEVSVDPDTGAVKLRKLTTAHDTGVIMNPAGHQGQIDGGIVQGIGYGLIECLPVRNGRVETTHFGDYKIPTVKDIPALQTVIVRSEHGVGPYKVKGIGENPVAPVAPAIANAVEDAVGARIGDLPITAEKVHRAIQERQKKNREE